MDYEKIYNDVILRAENRNLEHGFELHHVVPKCLGGSDEPANLVQLTYREHYLCHALLVKIHPYSIKLRFAFNLMCLTSENKKTSSRLFMRNRIVLNEFMKSNNPMFIEENRKRAVETRRKNGSLGGGKMSPDGRMRLSNRMKTQNPMKDKNVAAKVSLTRKLKKISRPLSEIERKNISERMKKDNPRNKYRPWESKRSSGGLHVWEKADEIFCTWLELKCSYARLSSIFYTDRKPTKSEMACFGTLVSWFRKSWNPNLDPSWVRFFKGHE